MQRSSSWFLRGGFAAISLLALSACVEGTTSSATATSPSEGVGTPAPPVTTPPSAAPPVVTVPATPPETPTAPATAAQPSTPLPSTAPAVGLLHLDGTWESPSCGSRTYPRRITFAEAASFTAEDLVSPCPKGVSCIWSGIINRQGTYRVEKDTITLTVAKTSTGPAKVEFPTTLTLDASHAPVEGGSEGKACVYKRAGGTRKP
jgi:hypothetical protein